MTAHHPSSCAAGQTPRSHLGAPFLSPQVSLITKSWFQGPGVSYLDCRNSHTTCAPDLHSSASSTVREQCTNLSVPFLLRTPHLNLFLLGYRQNLTEPGVRPTPLSFLTSLPLFPPAVLCPWMPTGPLLSSLPDRLPFLPLTSHLQ